MTEIEPLLRQELTAAMRLRDRERMAVVRQALAALDNATAVEVRPPGPSDATSSHVAGAAVGLGAAETGRRDLSDVDQRRIVADEVAELRRAATELEQAAPERAAQLLGHAAVLEDLLSR